LYWKHGTKEAEAAEMHAREWTNIKQCQQLLERQAARAAKETSRLHARKQQKLDTEHSYVDHLLAQLKLLRMSGQVATEAEWMPKQLARRTG